MVRPAAPCLRRGQISIFFLYADERPVSSHFYPTIDSLPRERRKMPMSERLAKAWMAAISAWRILLPKPPRYRPEAYYMRGPGPKWRAKHAAVSGQR